MSKRAQHPGEVSQDRQYSPTQEEDIYGEEEEEESRRKEREEKDNSKVDNTE